MLSFESRVGKVKMRLTTSGFTIICPKIYLNTPPFFLFFFFFFWGYYRLGSFQVIPGPNKFGNQVNLEYNLQFDHILLFM